MRVVSLGRAWASEREGAPLDDKLLQLVVLENGAVNGGA